MDRVITIVRRMHAGAVLIRFKFVRFAEYGLKVLWPITKNSNKYGLEKSNNPILSKCWRITEAGARNRLRGVKHWSNNKQIIKY